MTNAKRIPVSRFDRYGVITLPDRKLEFRSLSGKSSAEIHTAKIGHRQWIAEYRFRFLCGRFQGATLPLSCSSHVHATEADAIASAVQRLVADMAAKCPDVAGLSKVQQQEHAALVAWANLLLVQQATPLAGLRFVDLFGGIGGFHQALKSQGGQCIAAVEIDAAARETYRRNHGSDFPIFEDIRGVAVSELPAFDLLLAGFPCQSFSVAGNQVGYAATDKGTLFFEVVRIARDSQPQLILLENVPAFASIDEGKTADTAMDALAAIGYATSIEVLDAGDFGLPQQRERLFMVAHRIDLFQEHGTPFAFPVATDTGRIVADILEAGISTGICTQAMTAKPSVAVNSLRPIRCGLIDDKNMQGYRVYSPQGKGITLCASSGGPGRQTGLYLINGKPRRLTPRECARMQGFPDSFTPHPSASQACKQFGNAVAVPVVTAVACAAVKFL